MTLLEGPSSRTGSLLGKTDVEEQDDVVSVRTERVGVSSREALSKICISMAFMKQ
jgi:hypothetical protein